jgi:hypothetical protein
MQSPYASFDELFRRAIPIGRDVPNGTRGEAIIAAFAQGLFTAGPLGTFSRDLTRDDLPPKLRLTTTPRGRLLVWRFAQYPITRTGVRIAEHPHS